MNKSDIQKLGQLDTGAENWELLKEILTELWDKKEAKAKK